MNNIARLVCHPDTPSQGIDGVSVTWNYAQGRWVLNFTVDGAVPAMPPPAARERTDGLWQTTCFEMFVSGHKGAYVEFNFAPSSQWAAYRFTSYRQGMGNLPLNAPVIEPVEDGVRVTLNYPVEHEARIALSAVIQEKDGTKSYWALAHPPGKPDFHHPDCFTLRVSAGKDA